MSIRDIVIWPDPILETVCQPCSGRDEEELLELSNDLIDTCDAVGGLGLAAPQVGVDRQMFVFNVARCAGREEDLYETVLDPRVINAEGEVRSDEGCLSLPGVHAKVKRYESFMIEYTTLDGRQERLGGPGLVALALQHEMDHIMGIPMVKHLPSFKRTRIREKMRVLKRKMERNGVTYHDVIRRRED